MSLIGTYLSKLEVGFPALCSRNSLLNVYPRKIHTHTSMYEMFLARDKSWVTAEVPTGTRMAKRAVTRARRWNLTGEAVFVNMGSSSRSKAA